MLPTRVKGFRQSGQRYIREKHIFARIASDPCSYLALSRQARPLEPSFRTCRPVAGMQDSLWAVLHSSRTALGASCRFSVAEYASITLT